MMRNILVPTDFTLTSDNALEYTLKMNQHLNASIVLFHSYNVPSYATDIPVVLADESLKDDVSRELNELSIHCSKKYPGMNIKAHLSEGLITEQIVHLEERTHPDLVVMGTSSIDAFNRIFIHTSSSVLRKSVCPVLIIPPESSFSGMHKIVFATDYAEDDFENIAKVIELARIFSSSITLLHITDPDINRDYQYNELQNYLSSIQQEFQYADINSKLLDSSNTMEGINYFTDLINADLLAVSMRKLSAFRRVFEKSLTQKMVYHTHIPLLALHAEY